MYFIVKIAKNTLTLTSQIVIVMKKSKLFYIEYNMKKSIYHRPFAFAYVLLVAVIFYGCNYNIVDTNKAEITITEFIENAYFEGQKDALSGDIRIKQINDSCWIWIKSCWDSGKKPTFNPSILCDGGSKK